MMDFASRVKDVARGAATVFEMLQSAKLAEAAEERPLLSKNMQGALERLALVALEGLSENATELMDSAGCCLRMPGNRDL